MSDAVINQGYGYIVVPILGIPHDGDAMTDYRVVRVEVEEMPRGYIGHFKINGNPRSVDPDRLFAKRPENPDEIVGFPDE